MTNSSENSRASAGRELLLVGGAGPSPLSIDACLRAVTQAQDLGLRVTVTVAAADTPEGRAVAEVADVVVETDLTDTAQRERFLAELGDFDGLVFGVRDAMQLAVAEVAAALGVPGNPVDAVRRAVYKDLCRSALSDAGLRQPEVLRCSSAGEALLFLERTEGPWIVKPRNAAGCVGVTRVTGSAEIPGALAALPDPAGEFLVETYVDGAEFSVEGCFLGGEPVVLACTAKRTVGDGRFGEVGHVIPAGLPLDDEARLAAEVTRALKALGLRYGVFHVEGWIDAGEVVLGEVHTRVGGGWIHSLVEYVRPGLALFGAVYADALGLPAPQPADLRRTAAAAFFTLRPGVLAAVDGWAQVLADPRVQNAELTVGPGDRITPYITSLDRVGAVVVGLPEGSDESAEDVARRLCRSVVFTMADGSRNDGLGDLLPVGPSAVKVTGSA
ncbi:ATP-grasp domain-containing protein [Nonomuraea typhae]|uniref:ATP-grasp domain-containing protein n=1 Tax=Nonomuraea typhae TaxID=2603600 RepID=A0ABW7Z8Z5_9ACTN